MIKGKRYGKLVSIKKANNRGIRVMWLFQCDCGAKKEIQACRVANGTTKSCGCTTIKNASAANRTHGLYKHPLYKVWHGMKDRCNNPKNKFYHIYGGNGVFVCKRWWKFINFYNDMADGYSKGLLLDRKKNNLGYSKSNCRWVNAKVSGQNTASVKLDWNKVKYIRTAKKTAKQLAGMFSVGISTINDVRQNLTWIC